MSNNKVGIYFYVGLFAIIGIVALLVLSLKFAYNSHSSHGKRYYPVIASFDNIGTLKVNAPVRIAGYNVGYVKSIFLNQNDYKVYTTLMLDSRYNRLSLDTSAQIVTTGLIGEQYVSLLPGADTKYLHAGGSITYTSSAFVLENLITKFFTR